MSFEMSHDPQRVSAARRHLEEKFGLAMLGVTDLEISRALGAADLAAGQPERALCEQGPLFWERFVDELPIDESCLFRDPELWSWLDAAGLPPLVDRALTTGRRLQAVSLGCAGGQEAFSLAMVALQLFRARGMPAASVPRYVSIRGVDASSARIAAARAGTLGGWSVERAKGARWLEGLVPPHPALPGQHQVDGSVTALVAFEQGNLLELGPGALSGADLVLCRHVLIYFREARALELLAGIAAALDPGALLVVSSVEAHLLDQLPQLERCGLVGAARVRGAHLPAPRRAPAPAPPRPPAPPVRPVAAAVPELREAVAHLREGRSEEALKVARAVSYAQPDNVVARLFIGQALLGIDPPQARRVLEGLRAELLRLDETRSVPFDAELTVGQLRQAVGLLLSQRSGR